MTEGMILGPVVPLLVGLVVRAALLVASYWIVLAFIGVVFWLAGEKR